MQPDQKQPDQKQPDQKQPDQKQPDQKQPDQKQPDQKQPDQKQPDEVAPKSTKTFKDAETGLNFLFEIWANGRFRITAIGGTGGDSENRVCVDTQCPINKIIASSIEEWHARVGGSVSGWIFQKNYEGTVFFTFKREGHIFNASRSSLDVFAQSWGTLDFAPFKDLLNISEIEKLEPGLFMTHQILHPDLAMGSRFSEIKIHTIAMTDLINNKVVIMQDDILEPEEASNFLGRWDPASRTHESVIAYDMGGNPIYHIFSHQYAINMAILNDADPSMSSRFYHMFQSTQNAYNSIKNAHKSGKAPFFKHIIPSKHDANLIMPVVQNYFNQGYPAIDAAYYMMRTALNPMSKARIEVVDRDYAKFQRIYGFFRRALAIEFAKHIDPRTISPKEIIDAVCTSAEEMEDLRENYPANFTLSEIAKKDQHEMHYFPARARTLSDYIEDFIKTQHNPKKGAIITKIFTMAQNEYAKSIARFGKIAGIY